MTEESWVTLLSPHPGASLIFSGAGLSVNAPASIPAGLALTRRALEENAALGDEEIAAISELFTAFGMPGGFPRFETVLGAVTDTQGPEGLASTLRDVLTAQPNAMHRFCASHLLAGGTHLTANIDQGIERALQGLDCSSDRGRVDLVHFHGSADETSDLASLGITLRNVEGGFTSAMEDRLRRALTRADLQSLIFVGYSGTDYFDVTPLLAALAPDAALLGKTVAWLDFDGDDPRLRAVSDHPDPTSTTAETIALLREAGATVTVIRGDSSRALEAIADFWNIPHHFGDRPIAGPALAEAREFDPRRRARTRLLLFERLGYLPGITSELVDLAGQSDSRRILASAQWNRGKYKHASKLWSEELRTDPDGEIRASERRVACNWVSGRYLRALIGLRLLLRQSRRVDPAAEVKLVVIDTGVRLWSHMRGLPDVRWLATRKLRSRLSRSFPETSRLEPDLRDRILMARTMLDPSSYGTSEVQSILESARSRTAQTSSLIRSSNYRQGILRRRAEGGAEARTPDWGDEIRSLWDHWHTLGAEGEAVRLLTVPEATTVLGLRPSVSFLWRAHVDYSTYHRIRLSVVIVGTHLRTRCARRRARAPAVRG